VDLRQLILGVNLPGLMDNEIARKALIILKVQGKV
jgi:hypothetical protein